MSQDAGEDWEKSRRTHIRAAEPSQKWVAQWLVVGVSAGVSA